MSTTVTPRRAHILEAAVRVLSAHGQQGLTVRAVAQEAGCSTTGIYTWFGGKEGLLDAMYLDGFRRFRAYVGHLADAEGTERTESRARTALEGMAVRYREWALANPTHYVLMFAGTPTHFTPSPEAGAEAAGSFGDLAARVRDVLGPEAPEREVDLGAHRVWATLHGYVMLRIAGPGGVGAGDEDRFHDGVRAVVASLG